MYLGADRLMEIRERVGVVRDGLDKIYQKYVCLLLNHRPTMLRLPSRSCPTSSLKYNRQHPYPKPIESKSKQPSNTSWTSS